MTIEYQINMEDVVAFNEYHFENSPSFQKNRRIITIYAPIGIFLSVSVVGIIEHSWIFPIVGAIAATIYAIQAPRSFQKKCRTLVKTSFQEGKNKGTIGKQKLEINDDGLYNTSDSGCQTTFWHAVERIEQTDTLGFIYIASNAAHIIPKEKVIVGNFDEFMQTATASFKNHKNSAR